MEEIKGYPVCESDGDVTLTPKRCPFCGGYVNINMFKYAKECYLCCSQCGTEQPIYHSIEEAIEAWNKRVNDDTECLKLSTELQKNICGL